MEIFNVGNNAVNLFLIKSNTHSLLVDAGFANTLNDLGKEMRKTGLKIRDIDYLIVTHFHVDHAGLIQEIKNQGVKFALLNIQKQFIEHMETYKKKLLEKSNYIQINQKDNLILDVESSRSFLKQLNINGQIIHTKGHSEDSITLLLDSGEAFIGDLIPEQQITEGNELTIKPIWTKLKNLGAKKAYPSHFSEFEIT